MNAIGAICVRNEKYYAQILFPNALSPVDYYKMDGERAFVVASLCLDFLTLEIVDPEMLQLEIDYREMFGVPSEGELVLKKGISNSDLIKYHAENLLK